MLFGASGFGLGLAVALLATQPANATTHTANVLPGYARHCYNWGTFAWAHPCWHNDETVSTFIALDREESSGNANQATYWKHWGADSDQVVSVEFLPLPPGGTCTGVRVTLIGSGTSGDFHYLYIDSDQVTGLFYSTTQSWYSVPGYVEGSRYVGKTEATQPDGCPFDPGGHLHQSGDDDWTTSIYPNWTAGLGGSSPLWT